VIPYDDTTACILLFIGIHKKQARLEFQRRTAAVVGLGATGHYSQAFAVFTVAAAINWLLSQVAA
jgi:hypothetical protein